MVVAWPVHALFFWTVIAANGVDNDESRGRGQRTGLVRARGRYRLKHGKKTF